MYPYDSNPNADRSVRSSRTGMRRGEPMDIRPRLIIWGMLMFAAAGATYLAAAWIAAIGLANPTYIGSPPEVLLIPAIVLVALSVLPLAGRGAPWGLRIFGVVCALLVAWVFFRLLGL